MQHTIRYRDLDGYCDSLERTSNVQVMLKASRSKGYALWIENAEDVRQVVDDQGDPVWFRTVDQTLDELINIPHLNETFIIDRSRW